MDYFKRFKCKGLGMADYCFNRKSDLACMTDEEIIQELDWELLEEDLDREYLGC